MIRRKLRLPLIYTGPREVPLGLLAALFFFLGLLFGLGV